MATTNNIGLYCFDTGNEDAKTSLEALFGAGNSNMKKIDDAIGELKKKSFIVNTEAELNALLTEENLGKTVSFNGALYIIAEGGSSNAPIAVGDTTPMTLYFNAEVIPDFEAIKNDSTVIKGADIHEDYANAYFILAFGTESGEGGGYLGFYDMSEMQEGLFLIADSEMDNIIYVSQDVAGEGITAGWHIENIDVVDLISHGSSVTSYIVRQFGGQDLWSSYISKEPFTVGGGIIAKPVGAEGGGLPSFAPEDAGKFLRVDSNGNIVAEAIAYAEGESF